MNIETQICDCCGQPFVVLMRVEVGKQSTVWYVCPECYDHRVPLISKETDIPLLSTLFLVGGRG